MNCTFIFFYLFFVCLFLCSYDSSHENSGVITTTRAVKVTCKYPDPPQTRSPNLSHTTSFNPSPIRSHLTSHQTSQSFNQSHFQSNGGSADNSFNLSGASDGGAEFDDGPTFKEALRAFQNKGTGSASSSANTSLNRSSRTSTQNAQQILSSSTQRIERTMHMTSSNRSYHVEES